MLALTTIALFFLLVNEIVLARRHVVMDPKKIAGHYFHFW